MTNKVRCAVIGAGWWGTAAHVPALKRHPGAELCAIQHHDAVIAKKIANDFAVPQSFTAAEDVLEIEDLQAVVISSVPSQHYAQTKAALERGLHVLVEKPLCFSASEADELNELATARGVHAMVGATWHFTRHCVEARRLIQSGRLGQTRAISILMTNITRGFYQGLGFAEALASAGELRPEHQAAYLVPGRDTYSDPNISGGGQIHNQVSHVAAYVAFLTERQPVEVFARFHNDGMSVDVYDAITLILDDGTLVNIASNGTATARTMHYELRVHGTQGILSQELWHGTLSFDERAATVETYAPLTSDEIYPIEAPARNLIDTILGTCEAGAPLRHGVFATKVSAAAIESARTGRPIAISNR